MSLNLLTEAKAQQKKCCIVGAPGNCSTSKCMAWRWATQEEGFCGFPDDPRTNERLIMLFDKLCDICDDLRDIKRDVNIIINKPL